jgi:hypothetical protein
MSTNTLNQEPLIFCKPNGFRKYQLKYDWRKNKTDRFIFMRGQLVDIKKDYELRLSSTLSAKDLAKYDFYPNNSGSPVVNRRTLDLLKKHCPNDFQALPASIGLYKGDEFLPYDMEAYLINILVLSDSIDKNNSSLEYTDKGNISGITKLRFTPGSLKSQLLARLKGYNVEILASPTLVDIFKENDISGAMFLTAEKGYCN